MRGAYLLNSCSTAPFFHEASPYLYLSLHYGGLLGPGDIMMLFLPMLLPCFKFNPILVWKNDRYDNVLSLAFLRGVATAVINPQSPAASL